MRLRLTSRLTEVRQSVMPFSSQAYVVTEPGGSIQIQDVCFADVGLEELVIELSAFSVCASDVKAAKGQFHLNPPMILGHEAGGIVKDVGGTVTAFKPGDKVVLSYSSCKACHNCCEGANPYCEHMRSMNLSGRRRDGSCVATTVDGQELNALFFGQSSMARRFIAHQSSAVKIDATDEELQLFSAIGCGIQTGAGAILNVLRPKPASRIAVLGAGAVGLSACLAARLYSPTLLVVVDNVSQKLSLVPAEIKVDKLDTSQLRMNEIATRLKAMTSDGQGFDYVLDAVGGHGDLIAEGHRALRARGTLVTIGGDSPLSPSPPQFSLSEHLIKGVTYIGTHQGDSVPAVSIPRMIDLWREGLFPFDRLLTFYKFDQLDAALGDLEAATAIKPVLIA